MPGSGVIEDLYLSGYCEAVIRHIASTGFFQDWPACEQLLQDHLTPPMDQAWQVTLPLIACQAAGGDPAGAVPVSAAWGAMRLAAHLLDSVQDGDLSPTGAITTPQIALGVAGNLLFAMSRFLASVQPPAAFRRISSMFAEAGSSATLGQHLSLTQDYRDISVNDALEAYWKATILKSGSLYQIAAASGAVIGDGSNSLIQSLADYGNCLGVLLQILDDCRDVLSGVNPDKYEISLPLLLYLLVTGSDPVVVPSMHSREDLYQLLAAAEVPAKISMIMLAWQQRALESLKILAKSTAQAALEQIVCSIVAAAAIPTGENG